MKELIQKVLNHCGYVDEEPSKENLRSCFLDYVDSGIFQNYDVEDAIEDIESGEITVEMMCYNLLKR